MASKEKNTVAVILAGGEGYRLRPFTRDEPKVMMPIGNRPLMEYVVKAVVSSGIKDIIVVVGYKREKIQSYFKDGGRFHARINYVTQARQMGTLHALAQSRAKLKGKYDVLVLPGDNLIESNDLRELIHMGPNTALITESESPSKYGVCLVKRKRLEVIFEKPGDAALSGLPNTISTGIYLLDTTTYRAVTSMVKDGVYKLSEGVNRLLAQGTAIKALKAATWADVVYPWDLITLNSHSSKNLAGPIDGTVERGAVVRARSVVGPHTVIKAGGYIDSGTAVGEGCLIEPGCYISSSSIGNNVEIGANTVIKNSVIMDNVRIGAGCNIENSVVGYGAFIGAGTLIHGDKAGYMVAGEQVFVEVGGAVIGPDAKIGAGVVIYPGVIIGYGVDIRCGKVITSNVRDEAIVL